MANTCAWDAERWWLPERAALVRCAELDSRERAAQFVDGVKFALIAESNEVDDDEVYAALTILLADVLEAQDRLAA
jgi:hypothetical protein